MLESETILPQPAWTAPLEWQPLLPLKFLEEPIGGAPPAAVKDLPGQSVLFC